MALSGARDHVGETFHLGDVAGGALELQVAGHVNLHVGSVVMVETEF